MKSKKLSFRILDCFYIFMMILPIVCGIVLKVLTNEPSDEVSITGARVFFTLKMPVQNFIVSESQINSWLVMITIFFLCLYLTHGLSERGELKRQLVAEWIIEKTDGMIKENMGDFFKGFSPFIAAVMGLSAFSSLLTLVGLYPPTSDINIVGGWAILVFILITYYKMKCGFGHYLKSFADPALLTPMNVISEVATPVSMAFRHYGNVLSGSVISVLVAYALGKASNAVFGRLPGFLGDIPFLRVGIPAVLSAYFDVFSGLLQAFIFATLTMLYVSGGFPEEDYFEKLRKKALKKSKKSAKAE
ncbi:MAG: F0F1 ATP synthase subunit A [Acutalibacteraceae bacterium]